MIKERSQTKRLAGQRLMVGFDGTDFNEDLKFLIGTLQVGGLILFSRNLGEADRIGRLCRDCQAYAREKGVPPLFISIDQEGGAVARLKSPFTQFPGNPAMTKREDARLFARVTADELKQIGVNMNMAPVMDIAPEGVDSIMANRVFGSDPQWVSAMAMAVIDQLQKNRIMAVAKHFPGIGRTVLDSHLGLPDLNMGEEELTEFDLIPFIKAVEGGVAGIMLSHIRYTGIDPVWPASLSPAITKELLRNKLGYNGVVMTDDLDMGAIKPRYDIETAVRQVLVSDVDIALICHKGPDIETAYDLILHHLERDSRLMQSGQLSWERILKLKRQFLNL